MMSRIVCYDFDKEENHNTLFLQYIWRGNLIKRMEDDELDNFLLPAIRKNKLGNIFGYGIKIYK